MAYYILKSYKLKFDPFQIFCALKERSGIFFLDSSLNKRTLGRYSFLGFEPFHILKTKDQNPFPRLKEALSRYKICASKNSLPFLGGAVGYLSYDLGLGLEKKIKSRVKPDTGIPGCFFAFYNKAVIIDHLKKLLYLFSAGFPESGCRAEKLLCEDNFKKIYSLICRISTQKPGIKRNGHRNRHAVLKSNFSKAEYLTAVKKAKQYIKEGDIYQVNLSQEFNTRTALTAFEIYKRLRQISPAYFNAYLDCADFQILSSSPERFLCVKGQIVTTRPMKGTRRRGEDNREDKRLKQELLDSQKDRAELMMIVDLERNDLGRVCAYDSVRVGTLRTLEEYNTVFQTTASITGRLYRGKDRIDLLRACFPGGSITGCPKIRAMEIIDELEPHRRSIYTGCLGYLSFNGNMDFNILIRSILKKDNTVKFGVGGGIVADSVPAEEYRETLVKAKAMKEAIS